MLHEKCVECFLSNYKRLFAKYNVEETKQRVFLTFFNETMGKFSSLTSPEIQRILNNTFCKIIGVTDPFAEEKVDNNRVALELYSEWKPKVDGSKNPFDLALRLAIAGNIMDYGANRTFDIYKTIEQVLQAKFALDKSALLKTRIGEAKRILYLGDNAGEIVFDRLFIETINHSNVTFAVKGGPILNDVTIKDAEQAEIGRTAKIVSNGYDAPSTVLSRCSKEFQKIFGESDLIISKGQGNLEGLVDQNDSRIFFLLTVKCDVISELLNVPQGSFVVHNFE
ncbi:MAG TPA: ARMT1-like domain-containing protein [Tenuifilaceae bacterium]|nr:ARMT1-like domain-containing protein [Tenuifilaceae bacterium]HPE17893.1 ARMT1-like domain-containing protein [Tenuifilaceae bacterium]HPQ33185.1 ARMT1-like domain-containing protein [Tenuifilaceae bacterium]HRX68409.1 ARMT1-like domain-containing protein [Tenuifilaceae bacterium]